MKKRPGRYFQKMLLHSSNLEESASFQNYTIQAVSAESVM